MTALSPVRLWMICAHFPGQDRFCEDCLKRDKLASEVGALRAAVAIILENYSTLNTTAGPIRIRLEAEITARRILLGEPL